LNGLQNMEYDSIIITSYLKRDKIYGMLVDIGVNQNLIKMIFSRSEQFARE